MSDYDLTLYQHEYVTLYDATMSVVAMASVVPDEVLQAVVTRINNDIQKHNLNDAESKAQRLMILVLRAARS